MLELGTSALVRVNLCYLDIFLFCPTSYRIQNTQSVPNSARCRPHYTTLNDERVPAYNTGLGNRDSLVPEPRSTPSSTPISTISNSLVMIHTANIPPASNAQTPQLDDSTELEVSTLASSTLVSTKQHSIPPP
jgi:hypothetical protein